MEIRIKYDDGTTAVVHPKPVDLVMFERKFSMAATKIDEDPRMDYILFLAWAALRRTGQESRSYDDFLADLADIDEDEAPASVEDTPGPFPDPRPDSSQTSPV